MRLMKLLAVATVMLGVASSATAAPPPKSVDDAMSSNLASLAKEMRTDYKAWGLTKQEDSPTSFGRPYEVWSFKASMTAASLSEGSLQDSLELSAWEYPLLNAAGQAVNAAQVTKAPGGLWAVGAGLYTPPDAIALSADDTKIRAAFAARGISIQGATRHVRDEPLHLDFVLGRARDEQYALVLSNPTGSSGMHPGDVYPAGVLVGKLKDAMSATASSGRTGLPAPAVDRGWQEIRDAQGTHIPPSAILAVAVLAVTATLVVRWILARSPEQD